MSNSEIKSRARAPRKTGKLARTLRRITTPSGENTCGKCYHSGGRNVEGLGCMACRGVEEFAVSIGRTQNLDGKVRILLDAGFVSGTSVDVKAFVRSLGHPVKTKTDMIALVKNHEGASEFYQRQGFRIVDAEESNINEEFSTICETANNDDVIFVFGMIDYRIAGSCNSDVEIYCLINPNEVRDILGQCFL